MTPYLLVYRCGIFLFKGAVSVTAFAGGEVDKIGFNVLDCFYQYYSCKNFNKINTLLVEIY